MDYSFRSLLGNQRVRQYLQEHHAGELEQFWRIAWRCLWRRWSSVVDFTIRLLFGVFESTALVPPRVRHSAPRPLRVFVY